MMVPVCLDCGSTQVEVFDTDLQEQPAIWATTHHCEMCDQIQTVVRFTTWRPWPCVVDEGEN